MTATVHPSIIGSLTRLNAAEEQFARLDNDPNTYDTPETHQLAQDIERQQTQLNATLTPLGLELRQFSCYSSIVNTGTTTVVVRPQ